jgi:hypothetical protein
LCYIGIDFMLFRYMLGSPLKLFRVRSQFFIYNLLCNMFFFFSVLPSVFMKVFGFKKLYCITCQIIGFNSSYN